MEPNIVKNYLAKVCNLKPNFILMRNLREGKQKYSKNAVGVKKPILSSDYTRFLSKKYSLIEKKILSLLVIKLTIIIILKYYYLKKNRFICAENIMKKILRIFNILINLRIIITPLKKNKNLILDSGTGIYFKKFSPKIPLF